MTEQFERTALLLGEEAVYSLHNKRVAIFGVGGVGGYTVEALARAGIGTFDLIDHDEVALSNINRQIIATYDTVGRPKVEAAKERILSINPKAGVNIYRTFYLPQTEALFDFTKYDYVIDAIDTVAGKISLVIKAQEAQVSIISAMGAGNKLDPTKFEVADIYQTSVCPLARVMRRELKKRGVEKLKVVYSKEPALIPEEMYWSEDVDIDADLQGSFGVSNRKKQIPGSVSFVPSVVGLIMAGEVIKDLCGYHAGR